MKPRLIGISTVAIIIVLVATVIYLHPIGRTITPVSINTLDGKTVSLFQPGSNKITLVSFWASTCKPCIKEIPEFISLYNEYASDRFTMIGITMPYDPPDLTVAAVRHFNMPWPVALDIQGKWVRIFGDIKATPTTLLADSSGRVVWEAKGPVDFKQLKQKLSNLLAENRQEA